MGLGMRTWLRAARLRARRRRFDLRENRKRLIRRLAPGKTFIDVGGMFGIYGEMAFVAEEAGATRSVVFDGMDPSEEFQAEYERRSSSVSYVQGDLHDSEGVKQVGVFDIVCCAGVIYHSPNPYLQIEHLRRMTGERLILGTHTIPEIPGFEQACLFYPGMSAGARQAFAHHHGEDAPNLVGAATPFDRTPLMGYVNFWWGISPSALRAMLDAENFQVLEEFRDPPNAIDVLASPVDRPTTIPPLSLSRERGEARRASFSEGELPGWL